MPAASRVSTRSKTRDLVNVLTRAPLMGAAIMFDTRFPRVWPLRFPRTNAELEQQPDRLARALQSASLASPVAPTATFVRQQRVGAVVNEPAKDMTTAIWELTFREAGVERMVRVVTKLQSGRGMPMYMQAFRAATEPFLREVWFYRHLAGEVPVRVATPYCAEAAIGLNRVFLALEFIDGVSPSDARGCPLPAVRALLASAARLNAHYVGRLNNASTAWIPDRSGVQFAAFVEMFMGKASPSYKRVWQAIKTFFSHNTVTLVHGDCRPGNMLFTGAPWMAAAPAVDEQSASAWHETDHEAPSVVMSDWEATNIAPLLWDFTYCTVIGLRVADRRAWLDTLLDEFLQQLRANGVPAGHLDRSRARLDVDLLAMVLGFVSLAVYEYRLWVQGNAATDVSAWMARVRAAVAGIDVHGVAAALSLDVPAIEDYQRAIATRLVLDAHQ